MLQRTAHTLADLSPILVTGGAGFIGSHLVEALLARGLEVRVLDDLSTGHLDNLPLYEPNLELHTGDVINPAIVERAARGARACIHLATRPTAGASDDDAYGTILTSVLGAINVFEAAHRQGVRRVLFASSAAVYGEAPEPPFSERTTPRPVTPGGMEKLVIEGYAELFRRRHGLDALGLRYFNVYGPRQHRRGPDETAIPRFLRLLESRRPLELHGDGHQTRDYIHVEDAAQAVLTALTSSCTGVLNIGSGEATDTRALVDLLGRTLGMQPLMHFVPALPDEPTASCADISLLQQLGYAPAYSLRAGLSSFASDRAARRRLEQSAPDAFVAG